MIIVPFIPAFYGVCQQADDGGAGGSAPGQVTGLSVSAASSSQLNLSWNAVSGATTYKVERSTSSGSGYSQITSTASTSFNNTGLSASTTYYYRVRASNSAGDGSYSSVANGTTQSGGVSAPSAVSIATSASGNYNNAVFIFCNQDSLFNFLDINNGSTFSSNAATIGYSVGPSYSSAVIANNGILEYTVRGYIRATGATSFQWDLSNVSSNDGNSGNSWSSVTTNGSPSTAQNRITTDIGEDIKVVHSVGGRGYNLPAGAGGSSIDFDVDADATNSGGTTSASTLTVTLESN